jgi:HPt (histidine-containing phosphotransfer) domain-containing protein
MKIFCRDAEKAVVTLRETTDSQDLKLFKTTAHAMKAALANVGEHEASRQAEELENIGFAADTDRMIETLEALIAKYKSAGSKVLGSPSHDEDTAFLKAQLQIVKTACENYDDKAAYAAFDRLKEKQWKPENAAMLEELRGELFLHSDFDGVAERLASLI